MLNYKNTDYHLVKVAQSEWIGTQWWYVAQTELEGRPIKFSFYFDNEDLYEHCQDEDEPDRELEDADVELFAHDMCFCAIEVIASNSLPNAVKQANESLERFNKGMQEYLQVELNQI